MQNKDKIKDHLYSITTDLIYCAHISSDPAFSADIDRINDLIRETYAKHANSATTCLGAKGRRDEVY